jgi:hypothetical protein
MKSTLPQKLLFALFCITATTHSMEHKDNQLTPITFVQTYYHFSHFLVADVVKLIFSFHLDASGVDYENLPALIKEDYKNPIAFVLSINTLLKSNKKNQFAVELFKHFFHRTEISRTRIAGLFYIKLQAEGYLKL